MKLVTLKLLLENRHGWKCLELRRRVPFASIRDIGRAVLAG